MNEVTTPEAETRTLELNELTFELPVPMKDKTVHVFSLSDDGPSEFNLVVSRAKVTEQDTLEDFAERLSSELKRALAKFRLIRRQVSSVDGSPAVELLYGWSNNGIAMQQRQTVTLVQSASADEPEALMLAATCMGTFAERWHAAYDAIVASTKLRRRWPRANPPAADNPQAADPQPIPRYGFALSPNGVLHVLNNVGELPAFLGLNRAPGHQWKLYRHDGRPLETLPSANASGRSAPDGTVRLALSESGKLGPLQHRLALVDQVIGELPDVAAVQLYLRQWAAAEHLRSDVDG